MRKQYKAFLILFIFLFQNQKVFGAEKAPNAEFSADTEEELETNSEKHEFQAEVGRLMDIIINSLYTQKEIFLREIISNASDALDKIRFLAVSNPEVLGEESELAIKIEYDKEAKTLSISDSGIGMTKQDLINNLGTVAKSGTTNFIEAIKGGNLNLIGQFGVGFYSTFLAGSKVQVISKHNDDDQHIWQSSAANSFTVIKDPRGNTLKRGTKIIIHLKQDAQEFCEEAKIKSLVQKYSEFINFPIYLKMQKEVSKEVDLTEEELKEEKDKKPEEKKEGEEGEEKKDDLEVKDSEDKKDTKKTKTVKEKVWDWDVVNGNKAIWLRSKDEIQDDEYNKFYKSLTKDYDEPLTHIHFKVEGEVEFRALLFIPKRAPYDSFENYYGKSAALKLYVRRVLINEEFDELMPKYLNFIKGVVDSDELPLNVSRESLQQLKMMKVISRKLVRKTLEMVKNLAVSKEDDDEEEEEEEETKEDAEDKEKTEDEKKEEEDKNKEREKKKKEKAENKYLTFWKEFGKNIKLGIVEDPGNRRRLAQLSRWSSSKNTTAVISLDEYIARGKPGQDHIYFIAGENKEILMKSPILQGLLKRGYEVLLLDDPIDEFCFQHLNEYGKKKLVNVAKGGFKFPDDDDFGRKRQKKLTKMFEPLTKWWSTLMGETLEKVEVSQRLVDDPVVILSSEHGQSANMERITRAQAYAHQDRSQMQQSKKLLEINTAHPIIKELLERVKESPEKETEDIAKMLTETALINSGYSISNTDSFAKRFFKMFNGAMGISKDSTVEEIDLGLEDEEEDKDKKEEEEEKKTEDSEDKPKTKDDL